MTTFNNKDDPDFDDIIFTELPVFKTKFVRCHHKQRELLQRQMEKSGVKYQNLLKMCSRETGREIKDVGDLNRGECDRMIELLGGRAREVDTND